MRRWSARLALVLSLVVLVSGGAVPAGLPAPVGGSRFPLAGVFDWAGGAFAALGYRDPVTPAQLRGGPVAGGHAVPAGVTRANDGNGRPRTPGAGELAPFEPVQVPDVEEWTTPAGEGYVPGSSRWREDLSSPRMDVFANADGSFTQQLHQSQVNYFGSDGVLRPVQSRWSLGADGRWQVTGAPVQVRLGGAANGPRGMLPGEADLVGVAQATGIDELVSLTLSGGHRFGYGLADAVPVAAVVAGDKATYVDVLPHTSVEIVTNGTGVKETIILDSPQAGNVWVFPLDLGGLTAQQQADGAISLVDGDGDQVAVIPAPFMQDSLLGLDGELTTSEAVSYALITLANGRTALQVTADRAWLDDPARVYPVKVDPTTTVYVGGDVYIDTDPNTGASSQGGTSIAVGQYGKWINGDFVGQHKARAFMRFYDFDALVGKRVTGATLKLFLTWTSDCNHNRRVWVHPVLESVSYVTLANNGGFPGPDVGPSIGSKIITDHYPACTNSGGNRGTGEWHSITLNADAIGDWTLNDGHRKGLSLRASENDPYSWKRFTSENYNSGSHEPRLEITWTDNKVPVVTGQYPPSGHSTATLRPELLVTGSDADNWPSPIKYRFHVYDRDGALIADSGSYSSSRSWTVPAGVLKWGEDYLWRARAYDGTNYSPWPATHVLSTRVAQPPITSGLSQNSGAGFNPAIGNYTTSAVDAQVATVGPALSMERFYNSRDPRTSGSFGAGWSSILDAQVSEHKDKDGRIERVVITYPDGRQVAFGKNPDGTFVPPPGRFATLTVQTGRYDLTDKQGTRFTFAHDGGAGRWQITEITDASERALTLTYGTEGKMTDLVSASGRALHLSWAGDRVASVFTDEATPGDPGSVSTWAYSYTGDTLAKVCPPTSSTECVTYAYGSNSLHPAAVLAAGPHSYLRLGDAPGSTGAANTAIDSLTVLAGDYQNVTLGQPGPLPGSAATAATFNGTDSYAELTGDDVALDAFYQSFSMWFKTSSTTGGVLLAMHNKPMPEDASKYQPALYVGTDGKLYGGLYSGSAYMINSAGVVNDGQWHQVVLAAGATEQIMYLDGQVAGTLSRSQLSHGDRLAYGVIGAGKWSGRPATSGTSAYFDGSIAELALFDRQLDADTVTSLYSTGSVASSPLTQITRPSGQIGAQAAYDPVSGMLTQVTDANGGTWQLGAPQRSGSPVAYRSGVLAEGPADYWRLADNATTTGRSEVNGQTVSYSNVTLGVDGPYESATAAQFNGTDSVAVTDGPVFDTAGSYTVSAWVNLANGDDYAVPVGGTDGDYKLPFMLRYRPTTGLWEFYVVSEYSANYKWQAVTSQDVAAIGTWVHLAGVYDADAGQMRLYVDGQLQNTRDNTVAFTSDLPLRIGGRQGNSQMWDGSIAEVTAFDRALSGDDIKGLYATRGEGDGTLTKTVDVTDPGGNVLTYAYDLSQGGRMVGRTDARGETTSFAYDEGGFVHTVTDPNGNQTVTGHDVRGNVVSHSTCQDRSQQACSTTYYTHFPDNTSKDLTPDPRNDVVLTARDGRSADANDNRYLTSYTYDTAGNRTAVTDPLGRVTASVFTDGSGGEPKGLVEQVSTPGGATQSLTYTTAGDVAVSTDAAGKRVEYTYDGLGRMVSSTEFTDSFPDGLSTTFGYDQASRLVQRTDPQTVNRVTGAQHTAQTTIVYDADGRTVSTTVEDLTGGDASRTATNGYNTLGQLAFSEDPAGARTEYTYDAYGNIATRTGPDGVTVAYSYDGEGHLLTTTVKDWTGDPNNPSTAQDLLAESRAYDPAGRLAQITDAMGWQTRYTYTDNNLVATIVRHDPASGDSFTLESNVYGAAGHLTGQVTNDGVTGVSSFVDAAGRPTSHTLDSSGLNRTTSLTYGADDEVVSVQIADSSGVAGRTDRAYDRAGRLLAESAYTADAPAPLGRWKLDGDTTDAAGNSTGTATNVTWSSERDGAAVFNGTDSAVTMDGPVVDTARSFSVSAWVKLDSRGADRTVIAEPGSASPSFLLWYDWPSDKWAFAVTSADEPDPLWQSVLSTAVAATGTWVHLGAVFDASAGQVRLYVDGQLQQTLSDVVTWRGDQPPHIGALDATMPWDGSLDDVQLYQQALTASQIGALYNDSATFADSTVSRTSYSYDQRGLPTSTTDPNGNTSYIEYDEAGRPAVITSPSVTVEEYGQAPASAVAITRTGFDTFGLPVQVVDANGRQSQFIYDAAGRQTEAHAPAYTPPGGAEALTPVVKTEYDAAGRVVKTVDAVGGVTAYTYDQLGRVASVSDPASGTATFEYSLAGQQSAAVDASGARTEATWDFLGRPLTGTQISRQAGQGFTTGYSYATSGATATVNVTSPGGVTSATTFDAAGLPVSVVDGAGQSTDYGYDAAGRQVEVLLPDGTKIGAAYDLAGRMLTQTSYDSAGIGVHTQSQAFDKAGNVVSATDGRGHATTFDYDALGRVTSSMQPASASESITTSYGYDASGAPTRFTDGRGNAFWTTYNSLGLPESQIEPVTSAFSDEADRTYASAYDAAGRLVREDKPGGVSVSHTYDALGQLTRSSGAGAQVATQDRTFGYDAAGRITALSGSGGTNSLSWDDRGLLLSVTGPSGDSSFTYTADGLPATRADAAGTTNYGYDNAGRLASTSNPDTGVDAAYSYNSLSQVSQIRYGPSGDGNRRVLGYDDLHRQTSDQLRSAAGDVMASISYGYDANSNITSKTTSGFAGAAENLYTYDFADRLTSWTASGGPSTTYAYDKSGNRVQAGAKTFTYDARNRLTSDSDGTQYRYTPRGVLAETQTGTVVRETHSDAFGQIVAQQTSDTGFSEFTHDGLGRAIKPGHAYTGLGNHLAADQDALYTRSPGGTLIGASAGTDDRLIWADRHTDVVAQFTADGTALAGSAAFDPFGQVLSSSGMLGNLGYQSEWTDPGSGKVNMHARWYDPASGTFDSRDTASLSPVPASGMANRYAYANANPLAYTDPTGHAPMAGNTPTEHAPAPTPAPSPPPQPKDLCHLSAYKGHPDCQAKGKGGGGGGSGQTELNCKHPANFGVGPCPNPLPYNPDGVWRSPSDVDDGGGDLSCERYYPDGVNSGGYGMYKCGAIIIDPESEIGGLTPGVETNCATLADMWVVGNTWRSATIEVCGGLVFDGIQIVSLDDLAMVGHGVRFVDLDEWSQRYVFTLATCINSNDLCNQADEVFDVLFGLIPVIGTAYDILRCTAKGDLDACAWIVPSLIPGAKIAQLTKLGKLGKLVAADLRAINRRLSDLRVPNGGLGRLIEVYNPDPAADALAGRISGLPRRKFANDPIGREFDVISKLYIAQTKPANFKLNKAFRDQAKATFEMAIRTGRSPYFHFEGAPDAAVIRKIQEYSTRYDIQATIDVVPLGGGGIGV